MFESFLCKLKSMYANFQREQNRLPKAIKITFIVACGAILGMMGSFVLSSIQAFHIFMSIFGISLTALVLLTGFYQTQIEAKNLNKGILLIAIIIFAVWPEVKADLKSFIQKKVNGKRQEQVVSSSGKIGTSEESEEQEPSPLGGFRTIGAVEITNERNSRGIAGAKLWVKYQVKYKDKDGKEKERLESPPPYTADYEGKIYDLKISTTGYVYFRIEHSEYREEWQVFSASKIGRKLTLWAHEKSKSK